MIDKLRDIWQSRKRLKPLVLQDDVWHVVFDKLTAIGSGEHVLPSDKMSVVFLTAGRNEENILISSFGEDRLQDFLRSKLREERCRQAEGLQVRLDFTAERPAHWADNRDFDISFGSAVESGVIPTVTLKVLGGKASKTRFKVTRAAINIGRGREIKDKYGTLIRRNDVDFNDEMTEPNNSVSKLHGRIEYSEADGAYYLSDSGFEYGLATNGTRLIRGGSLVAKLNADQKVQLQNGDEIHLGKASVRFEISLL
jgi:hypothetical protein